MHIRQILSAQKTTISFEFFPPKTDEAAKQLYKNILELQALKPSFVTVTYGAGGSTRDRTHDLVVRLEQESGLTAVAHLTSVGHTREELRQILERYAAAGVQNIMALGGDLPKGQEAHDRGQDAFRYAAELTRFIHEFSETNTFGDGQGFGIGVAGYPEGHAATPNRLKEMDYLKQKVDAGADYLCTQLFFDNHEFYDFRERCELAGIRVPILAGIMPLHSRNSLHRMAELSAGTRFPATLLRNIERCQDDTEVARVGLAWATEQCQDLLQNDVRGLHFYTLNRSQTTREVFANLFPHPAKASAPRSAERSSLEPLPSGLA